MVVRASVGLLVLLVAIDEGGYAIVGRQSLAVVVWWTLFLGFALGLLPRASGGRAFVVAAGSIAALAGLTLASLAWGANPEVAFLEFDRVLLYGGVFLLVATASTPRDAEPVCDGLALGIVAVACVALGSRLVPGVAADADIVRYLPAASERLAYPVGYWNGLGFLLALGVPLLLRPAVASERPWTRAAAIAGLRRALLPSISPARAERSWQRPSLQRRSWLARSAAGARPRAAIAAAATSLAAAALAEFLLRDPAETGGGGLVAGGALAALSLAAGASYAAATVRLTRLPGAPGASAYSHWRRRWSSSRAAPSWSTRSPEPTRSRPRRNGRARRSHRPPICSARTVPGAGSSGPRPSISSAHIPSRVEERVHSSPGGRSTAPFRSSCAMRTPSTWRRLRSWASLGSRSSSRCSPPDWSRHRDDVGRHRRRSPPVSSPLRSPQRSTGCGSCRSSPSSRSRRWESPSRSAPFDVRRFPDRFDWLQPWLVSRSQRRRPFRSRSGSTSIGARRRPGVGTRGEQSPRLRLLAGCSRGRLRRGCSSRSPTRRHVDSSSHAASSTSRSLETTGIGGSGSSPHACPQRPETSKQHGGASAAPRN